MSPAQRCPLTTWQPCWSMHQPESGEQWPSKPKGWPSPGNRVDYSWLPLATAEHHMATGQ